MKGKSIIEVVIVFLIMKLFSIWFDTWLSGMGVHYWWRNIAFGLQAIVFPLAIIWLSKRSWAAYGLGRANFRYFVHYGFVGAMLMMLTGFGFGFLQSQKINPSGMEGSIFMSAIGMIMIVGLLFAFRNINQNNMGDNRQPRIGYKLIILIGLVLCPVVIALIRKCLTLEIIAWDSYFLFMVGFGEEIKYRGYFQSRINEEYGRPWEFWGIQFGPGVIVVSILFGLSHVGQFGSFNPFQGQFDINPWMGLQAFFGSLFFGLIREKSGSVIPSSIAHGVPNAFGQTLAKVLG